MLINEHFRRCVSFLYTDVVTSPAGATERTPMGTAFFVGVDLLPEYPRNRWAIYAVTARHVAEAPDPVYLRLRLKSGGYTDAVVEQDAWYMHPKTDVAVASMAGLPLESFDFSAISTDEFASQEFVAAHTVGEGDDVFFSGLFVGHYGKGAPQPIIRFGNVALMPREPVKVQISKRPHTTAEIEAYLVEARSWGGQSGSPAFLSFSPDRHMGGGLRVGDMPPFALLGLVQGTWKDQRGTLAPDPSGEGVVEVNMGIAVVVPAYKIMEALMDDDVAADREQIAENTRKSLGSSVEPVASSAEEVEGEPDFTREDFMRDLGRASRQDQTPPKGTE